MKTIAKAAVLTALIMVGTCAPAPGKGLDTMPATDGPASPFSPYRYLSMTPRHPKQEGRTTTLAQIDRRGGEIDRWWFLRGSWMTPAITYDGSGGGLSADGGTLVLSAFRYAYPRPGRWSSRFAIVDTRRPQGLSVDEAMGGHPVRRISLSGDLHLAAISPDGGTLYFDRYTRPGYPGPYEVRAFDVASGKLRPGALFDSRGHRHRFEGPPITATSDREGRWNYVLHDGNDGSPYLQALDTERGRVVTVGLPQLADDPNPFLLNLQLGRSGRELFLSSSSAVQGKPGTGALLSIDTRTFAARKLGGGWLAFARTPRGPGNLLGRNKTIGHSTAGRPIVLHQLGDPKWSGELLVFGCIHGDECAASRVEPLTGGCPDPSADVYLVPNLDPDGTVTGSRLNGRGVDLNRNFPSEWKPIGSPWSAEFSGSRPFSEPETRLAAQVIRSVRPAATIWFHQFHGERPLVRAWGQSNAGARHFARLARMPFRAMRWPRGTGPNWQNHAFPGAAFVVELPPGRLEPEMRSRLSKALVRMGRWVRED